MSEQAPQFNNVDPVLIAQEQHAAFLAEQQNAVVRQRVDVSNPQSVEEYVGLHNTLQNMEGSDFSPIEFFADTTPENASQNIATPNDILNAKAEAQAFKHTNSYTGEEVEGDQTALLNIYNPVQAIDLLADSLKEHDLSQTELITLRRKAKEMNDSPAVLAIENAFATKTGLTQKTPAERLSVMDALDARLEKKESLKASIEAKAAERAQPKAAETADTDAAAADSIDADDNSATPQPEAPEAKNAEASAEDAPQPVVVSKPESEEEPSPESYDEPTTGKEGQADDAEDDQDEPDDSDESEKDDQAEIEDEKDDEAEDDASKSSDAEKPSEDDEEMHIQGYPLKQRRNKLSRRFHSIVNNLKKASYDRLENEYGEAYSPTAAEWQEENALENIEAADQAVADGALTKEQADAFLASRLGPKYEKSEDRAVIQRIRKLGGLPTAAVTGYRKVEGWNNSFPDGVVGDYLVERYKKSVASRRLGRSAVQADEERELVSVD